MLIGCCGIIEPAQRDPAREECDFGQSRAGLSQPAPGGERVGGLILAFIEKATNEDLTLTDPRGRTDEVCWSLPQRSHSVLKTVIAPEPSGMVENETGIIAQRFGYVRKYGFGIIPLIFEREACFGT